LAPVVSGFSEPKEFDDEIDDLVENAMNKFFRPEFLNRMDGKVIFKSLKQEDVLKIAENRMNEEIERINRSEAGIKIDVKPEANKFIAEKITRGDFVTFDAEDGKIVLDVKEIERTAEDDELPF